MKATKIFALASVLVMASYTPTALVTVSDEENIKMHCVILKNGKVVHQQSCVADIFNFWK